MPFRIILSFALAAVALYQGYSHHGTQTLWYGLAGVSVIVGIVRLRKYRQANTPSDQGSSPPA